MAGRPRQHTGNLFGDFAQELKSVVPMDAAEIPPSVGAWAQKAWRNEKGVWQSLQLDVGGFSFGRHEYLIQPYNDDHPYQVEMKAAQMGNTTRAFLRTFFWLLFEPMVRTGVLYLFPTSKGVGDFSRSRLSPFIEKNPPVGARVEDTDSVGLKRIAGKNLILRGMRSEEGLRSDPADAMIIDEVDLVPQDHIEVARKRMGHSDYAAEHYLSNPTIPDYGIDALFQQTDQRYWMLKCPKCGGYTCMEDTFPDCLHETDDGRVIRLCMECRNAELDPAQGEWVAKYPSVTERRGYHYSKLFGQLKECAPEKILHTYRTTRNMGAFHNYDLGLPYIEAQNRLSVEEVLALCGSHGVESSSRSACVMGVDQGKNLHVRIETLDGKVIHLGVYQDYADLDRLMRNFRVSVCVEDAMPETRPAREFSRRHPGKVFLNYYSEHLHGDLAWNEEKMTVTSNRTESLDAMFSRYRRSEVVLPRECEIVREEALHLHNLAKVYEEKEDGSKRAAYVKLGADHFAHAANYCTMARSRAVGSYFGGCDAS